MTKQNKEIQKLEARLFCKTLDIFLRIMLEKKIVDIDKYIKFACSFTEIRNEYLSELDKIK